MWKAVFLSFWCLSLPFTGAFAATNKNSVANSMTRFQSRQAPRTIAAAPHLVTPSPNPIRPFSRPGGYYSLGGSLRARSVPLPRISTFPAPFVKTQPIGARPSFGSSEYSRIPQAALERRQPATQPNGLFSKGIASSVPSAGRSQLPGTHDSRPDAGHGESSGLTKGAPSHH